MSAVFVQSVQHRHHVPPFFLVLLVVGSAVQKKRGHQRGVAREGQQQSKKSLAHSLLPRAIIGLLWLLLLLMRIHFVFPGDKMES